MRDLNNYKIQDELDDFTIQITCNKCGKTPEVQHISGHDCGDCDTPPYLTFTCECGKEENWWLT